MEYPGAEATRIYGNGALTLDRVLDVLAGPLAVSHLAVHDGATTQNGGGISAEPGSPLFLDRVGVSGNSAQLSGGGVFGNSAVTMTDSTLRGNTADSDATNSGAAGGVHSSTTLTAISSLATGNTARFSGGLSAGVLASVHGSTVTYNKANVGGGGIGGARIDLTETTVRGNEAVSQGGDISAGIARASVTDSEVSGNEAWTSGGGIQLDDESLVV